MNILKKKVIFRKYLSLLLHKIVWLKWAVQKSSITVQKLSIFGNFAVPKGLGMVKRLNDRSSKLLGNNLFYFYKNVLIKMNFKKLSFFGNLVIPKGLGV